MTEPRAWIENRRPSPPPTLERDVLEMLARWLAVGDLPEALAGTALAALPDAARAASSRRGARPLLAVDTLLTFACEAAAEAGEAALDRLLDRLGPDRFAAALEAAERS